MCFEIYQIQVFDATQLSLISIPRAIGSLEIIKYTENTNSKGLSWIKNENVFPPDKLGRIMLECLVLSNILAWTKDWR